MCCCSAKQTSRVFSLLLGRPLHLRCCKNSRNTIAMLLSEYSSTAGRRVVVGCAGGAAEKRAVVLRRILLVSAMPPKSSDEPADLQVARAAAPGIDSAPPRGHLFHLHRRRVLVVGVGAGVAPPADAPEGRERDRPAGDAALDDGAVLARLLARGARGRRLTLAPQGELGREISKSSGEARCPLRISLAARRTRTSQITARTTEL